MENLITFEFDSEFKSRIKHFENYPELLPFVGKKWNESSRVLLIGESHYLPYEEANSNEMNFDFFNNWYQGKSIYLEEYLKSYINTRNNIIKVERKDKHEGPLNIYYNLRSAIKELEFFENEELIFDKFAYYNYFQKPASVNEIANENRSIKSNDEDNLIALKTLEEIVDILNVKTVIFISVKSFDAFNLQRHQSEISKLSPNVFVEFVPHAGRPWWNRSSNKYAFLGHEKLTGKEKFKAVLKSNLL